MDFNPMCISYQSYIKLNIGQPLFGTYIWTQLDVQLGVIKGCNGY